MAITTGRRTTRPDPLGRRRSPPPPAPTGPRHPERLWKALGLASVFSCLVLLGMHARVFDTDDPGTSIDVPSGLAEFVAGGTSEGATTAKDSEILRECTYEGNCPALSYCGASGFCRPYLTPRHIATSLEEPPPPPVEAQTTGSSRAAVYTDCVQTCFRDARMDEEIYFGSDILNETVRTMVHHGTDGPDGCVVVYQPSGLGSLVPISVTPTQEQQSRWQETKSGRLIRRDALPMDGDDEGRQRWAVLCYNPCRVDSSSSSSSSIRQHESDESCLGSGARSGLRKDEKNGPAIFKCVKRGNCERRNQPSHSNYALSGDSQNARASTAEETSDLVVLSYSDSGYFSGLQELAASLEFWAPKARLCVYNLGMTSKQLKAMEDWTNLVDVVWKDGFPEDVPPHARIGKVYAWKPIMIDEAVRRYGKILVIDAGSVIRGPLDPLEDILERTGNFLVQGQDLSMKPRAHSQTFAWFGYKKSTFVGSRSYGGGTQGYLYPSDSYDNIVVPMRDCAMNETCINPEGAKLSNHRYDQTVLSILAIQYHVMAQPHTEYLAATNPCRGRETEACPKIIWTARKGSRFYSQKRNNGPRDRNSSS